MKRMKKYLCFFLAALTVLFSVCVGASAADNKCGDSLFWSFDAGKGELLISGSGDMADFDEFASPWASKVSEITSVSLPDGLTGIGEYAFCGCDKIGEINIPSSVLKIGAGAFEQCDSLTGVVIPGTVKSVADYTFSCCTQLENVTLPDGLESIGAAAFDSCAKLKSINIPSGVTYIGDGAFFGCALIENAEIPDGVSRIGNLTFCNCSSLKNVTVGAGVTEIGDGAFANCTSLSKVIFNGTTAQWKALTESESFGEGNEALSNADFVPAGDPVKLEVNIVGYKPTLDVDYKSTVVLHTDKQAPQGCKIVWSDGTTGNTFKAEKLKANLSISAKIVRVSDNTVIGETKTENINVSSGFFAKIIAFFREWFTGLPVYIDNIKQ